MVNVSYHGGHSSDFCCHAVAGSTKQSMLDAYLAKGFGRNFALIEHMPSVYVYPDEQTAGFDAVSLAARFDRFFEQVRPGLKKRCPWLPIGFETEWVGTNPVRAIKTLIERHAPDIVVASLHHVNDIAIDFDRANYDAAVSEAGGLEQLSAQYFDAQAELISGMAPYTRRIPVILGHMDLIWLFAPDFVPTPSVADRIRRNVRLAVESGLVFEINARGVKKIGRPYPCELILQEIQGQGGRLTLGDDAHGPDEVGNWYRETTDVAAKFFSSVTAFELAEGGGYRTVEIDIRRGPARGD